MERTGCTARNFIPVELQRSRAGDGQAFAGLFGSPDAEILFKPVGIKPTAHLAEPRLQPELVRRFVLDLQPDKLQAQTPIRQRHGTICRNLDQDAALVAMPPLRQQCATPQVQNALMLQVFAAMLQNRGAIQQHTDAEPVRHRHQGGNRGIDIGRVEQPGDVGARPGRPFEVRQPRHPGRPSADRASPANPKKSVADGEACFDADLARRIVALLSQQPLRIRGRFQRLQHVHDLSHFFSCV